MIFIGWIVLSFIVGALGSDRTTGFWGGLFLSLLLSPAIGLIIVLCSKNKEDEKQKEENTELLKKQAESLDKIANNKKSLADEISELDELKSNGTITSEEYKIARGKLFS